MQRIEFIFDTEQEERNRNNVNLTQTFNSEGGEDGVPKGKEYLIEERRSVKELKGNISELWKKKLYRNNLIVMTFIWSFGSFGSFLIPFYLTSLSGNIYLYAIFSAIAEVMASIVCALVTKKFSLKILLLAFNLFSAGAGFLLLFFGDMDNNYVALLILFANFGIISSFDISYLINCELFPTIFLATAYGSCNILGRMVSILSP